MNPSAPRGKPATSLYERVIGDDWQRLPQPLRELHSVTQRAVFEGEARVENGSALLSRCLRSLIGFPRAAERVAVRVTIERRGDCERWTRQFGRQRFRSVLRAARNSERGVVVERFGALSFRLQMPVDPQGLRMIVQRATSLGLELPDWLTPTSVTRETVDALGRFHFDVDIGLPRLGRIVRYRGWLVPVQLPAETVVG